MHLICDTKINNKIINRLTSTTDINLTQARDTRIEEYTCLYMRKHVSGFLTSSYPHGLFSNRRWQTALNFGFRKQGFFFFFFGFFFFNVAKTYMKALGRVALLVSLMQKSMFV